MRGAIASGQYFERSVVDICPHSLGIAAVGEEDFQGGLNAFDEIDEHPLTFVPLIPVFFKTVVCPPVLCARSIKSTTISNTCSSLCIKVKAVITCKTPLSVSFQ